MFKNFDWKNASVGLNHLIVGGLFAAIALMNTSCGSDSSSGSSTEPDEKISEESSSSVKSSSSTNSSSSVNSSGEESLVTVAAFNDLPECTDNREDEWIRVTSEARNYFCFRQKWYKTVKIGSQVWMAENLDFQLPKKFYDETTNFRSKYGMLYTWTAAMDTNGLFSNNTRGCGIGPKCDAKYPVRGICPKGWHLPAKEEFETLVETVGGVDVAGKKLKATDGWSTVSNFENGWGYLGTNANGTDDYGFTALPAGVRDDEVNGTGYETRFWTSTEGDIYKEDYFDEGYEQAFYLELTVDYKDEDVSRDGNKALIEHFYKEQGYSVRCVKD